MSPTNYTTIGSGNNGQVQLWQFLLEILTDCEHTDIIEWVGTDGEFKLSDPGFGTRNGKGKWSCKAWEGMLICQNFSGQH